MSAAKPLLRAVLGERQPRPPIWIMRQAGRYLPEYRQVRESVGGFLELCYTPRLAAEVTLQPLRRFDLDAAILFSDILVIPDALGQAVRFEQGEGPSLDPLGVDDISRLNPAALLDRLSPMFETLSLVRSVLPDDKALIGFCGAPWTVATYMLGGRGSADQATARIFALTQPEAFSGLIDVLVEASTAYLVAQLRAGADVVQIFESWASSMDEQQFADWVIGPNARIVAGVRREIPDAAIIGFPRGAGAAIGTYARGTGVSAVGLDQSAGLSTLDTVLPAGVPVQGNLDPMRLVAGGEQLATQVRRIIAEPGERPHIFNLGHGILPQTPIAHVEQLVALVKAAA